MLDKPGNDVRLAESDPNLKISVGAFLGEEGGYRQFLQERLTGLNPRVRFIHTKYLLIDPLTDHPVVITGSANFSMDSTTSNDENMLWISGNERVADIYLTEFMRLFTHFRFRGAVGAKRADRMAPSPADPAIVTARHLTRPSRGPRRSSRPIRQRPVSVCCSRDSSSGQALAGTPHPIRVGAGSSHSPKRSRQ